MTSAPLHITAEAAKMLLEPKKRSKYGNRKVTVNGRSYDSLAEAKYCEDLLLREKAGEVGGVELQRPFSLIGPDGTLIATYRADACFWDFTEDRFRVVDVKGGRATQTPAFRLKKKMMKSFLGLNVEVVGG